MNTTDRRGKESRARRLIACASGVAAMALAEAAPAQVPSSPARPEYRVLRFDENWTSIRDASTRTRLDELKYLPLTETGAIYLSVGGQFRSRVERVSNLGLNPAPEHTDAFGLVRALVHADLHAGERLRLFVEGKHAVALGRDLPGGRRPLDHDEWELQNAFVDVSCCVGLPVGVTARLGRQELLLGSQRLVSPLDWSNTRRSFEGLRLTARSSSLTVDGFVTRPVTIRTAERNRRDPHATFWGIDVRPPSPSARFAWDLYLLGLAQDGSAPLWGYEGHHERFTFGGRFTGTLGSPSTRYDLEAGWQTGSLGDHGVSAWFLATELSRGFPGLALRPVASVGFDRASGDADPADDRVGTFHQLYPLGHAYAGYLDLLGRQNLVELRGALAANPTAALQVRGAVHRFLRARTTDAAYNVGGGILWSSTGEQRAIGSELNLTLAYRATRFVRLEGGYGRFWPGAFLTESPAGAVRSDWVYASTAFTY